MPGRTKRGELTFLQNRILSTFCGYGLRKGLTVSQVAHRLEIEKVSVNSVIRQLMIKGMLVNIEHGKYKTNTKNLTFLAWRKKRYT